MHLHKYIGIFAILVSLGLIGFQAVKSESIVTFYTPAEVYANPSEFAQKRFRVSGLVLEGSKQWNPSTQQLSFKMSDMQGHDFFVTYKGMPPDLFKERQGVVVEGKIEPSIARSSTHDPSIQIPYTLSANLLMVKHSEVYSTQGNHSELREMRLKESLFNTHVQK